MKKKAKATRLPQSGMQVLDIPLAQILPDPHQPRRRFNQVALQELAMSIKAQGLQQLPTVNFAYERDGLRFYYLKAGERRFRAHQLLQLPSMRCFVEPQVYTGIFDVDRKLAQAAENSSREPHAHVEIIEVMENVYDGMLKEYNGKVHGVAELAMGKVAQAFGKSRAWAQNYYTLMRLHPELREMLDTEEEALRLNFNVATALARVPSERQRELLDQAKGLKERGGHQLMYKFIVRQAQALREGAGAGRRRKPSDDKAVVLAAVNMLHRQAMSFVAERRSSEHVAYLSGVMSQLHTIEVDQLLSKLNEAMLAFGDLQKIAKARRDFLYQGLRVVK